MRKTDAENGYREAVKFAGQFGETGRHSWNGNDCSFHFQLCSSLSSSMVYEADTVCNATLQMFLSCSYAGA